MAIVKIKLTKKINNVVNDYYPKTSADNVVYDSNNTVEDKLNAIETTLTAHAVTNKGSAFVSGLYKITTNSEGHVTAATPVTKSDITELGISDAAATQTALNGKQSVLTFDNAPAEQSENPVKSSGIYYALAGKISTSAKGVNGGVAELDANGKVPSSQLPSYVDDVLSYNSLSDFPATGEDGKIYIAKNTNLSYRWTGSDYAVISPSLALGNTSSTAYRGDWGAQDRAAIGTLTSLQTTAKSDLVAAINEIKNVLTFDSAPTENSTNPVTSGGLFSALSGKVDAEANKGLSTNDYTTAEKTKLSGIESGAEANVQSDWNQTDTTADDFIKNKPTNATASAAGLMSPTDFKKINARLIAANSDLNDIKGEGWYFCNSNNTVATFSNCPTYNAFYLEVHKHAGTYQHIVEYPTTGAKHFHRNFYNNVWGNWVEWKLTDTKPDWNQSDTTADDFIKNKPDLSVYAPATFDDVGTGPLSYNNMVDSNGKTIPKTVTLKKNAKNYRLLLVRYYVTTLGGVQLWDYIMVPSPNVTSMSTFLKAFDLSGGTLTEYIFGLQFSADGTTMTLSYGVNNKIMYIQVWGIK